ncbi:nitro/flavin reductase [Piromyces finnis]|uniref:Nitro/flavin reductase n=1 Tax=Piromyces finnis TaxID=1754191 RepID=A0A1Y1V9V9_9FUNG|nr:nitro/flavin reductase [Piromyces finnis]|eukprot:ORX49981.1 nitro/flavin reductase [Piromyces finnis]
MNPVLESLFKHQSIRKYKDQPIEQEKLELIIKAAQVAPNWCNGQQVSIIAVKDKERKAKLCHCCFDQPWINECPVFLIFCADNYRTNLIFNKNNDKEGGERYIKKLDTVVIGSHDVGIAMQNAVVAAESMGLGTVPIGGIRIQSLEVVDILKLPKYVIPIVGLCVGYPDANPGIKPRLPPKAVYFEETYNTEDVEKGVAEYDEEYKKYLGNRSENERESTWTDSVYSMYGVAKIPNQDYELFKQQGYIEIENKEN